MVELFKRVNGAIRKDPQILTTVTAELGLKPDETKAAALLPQRLTPAYATE